ncbi:MAG: hypothetical protein NDI61_08860 [Bdellovibrionaceae bacterium]|nr:hypothetical protein [Pseudobdellovibrionaceae bacterium]
MKLIFTLVTLVSPLAYAGNFNYSLRPEPSFQIQGENVVGITNITYEGSPILTMSPEDKFKQTTSSTNTSRQNFQLLCEKMGFKQIVTGGGISINAMKIGLPARFAMVQNGQVVVTTVTQENPMGTQLSVITGLACTTR